MRKKKILNIILILLLCFLSVLIYYNSSYYIKKHEWKHTRNSSFGDWIDFSSTIYELRGKTIYKRNVQVGKVVFCFKSYLFVFVDQEKSIGYYYKK